MGTLRLLLALSVVFAHAPWRDGVVFVGGRCSVQIFYMISGFLMSHILVTLAKYPTVTRFYASRWLRIFPLYYVVAGAALLFDLLHRHSFFHIYRDVPLSAAVCLILSNIFIFGQDWIMFLGVKAGHLGFTSDFKLSDVLLYRGLVIPQAWTLGLELSFYLIAPCVLRRRWAMVTLLILAMFSRATLFSVGLAETDPWTYRFFPAELFFFLGGAFSNQLLLPLSRQLAACAKGKYLPEAATGLTLIYCVTYFLIPANEWVREPILFSLILFLLPAYFIFQERWSLDAKVGELSYPVYIGHMVVLEVLLPIVDRLTGHNEMLMSTSGALGSIAFAVALNRSIGHNIEKFRSRLSKDVAISTRSRS